MWNSLRAWILARTKLKGVFYTRWYLTQNPSARFVRYYPLLHYLIFGVHNGLDPHPLFDTDWYLAQNPDVAATGENPLVHYLRVGATEGRDPNPLFDTDWYLTQNPGVAAAGENPLAHYLSRGAAEGRDPNPLFDTDWYLTQYPDVAAARQNPLEHYLCGFCRATSGYCVRYQSVSNSGFGSRPSAAPRGGIPPQRVFARRRDAHVSDTSRYRTAGSDPRPSFAPTLR